MNKVEQPDWHDRLCEKSCYFLETLINDGCSDKSGGLVTRTARRFVSDVLN